MLSVSNGFETNFLCEGCGRCWSVSMGRASLVDPLTCPGCGHERVCRRRLVDEMSTRETLDLEREDELIARDHPLRRVGPRARG
jgi:hypothetical protein